MPEKMLDHVRDFAWLNGFDLNHFLWQSSKNPARTISSQASPAAYGVFSLSSPKGGEGWGEEAV
jgi:hypothetical protein